MIHLVLIDPKFCVTGLPTTLRDAMKVKHRIEMNTIHGGIVFLWPLLFFLKRTPTNILMLLKVVNEIDTRMDSLISFHDTVVTFCSLYALGLFFIYNYHENVLVLNVILSLIIFCALFLKYFPTI